MIKACAFCTYAIPHPILGNILIKCEIKKLYEHCNAWFAGFHNPICDWYKYEKI